MGRRLQGRASPGTDASLEGSRLEILGWPLGETPMVTKKPSLFHRDEKEKQPLVTSGRLRYAQEDNERHAQPWPRWSEASR